MGCAEETLSLLASLGDLGLAFSKKYGLRGSHLLCEWGAEPRSRGEILPMWPQIQAQL